MRYIIYSSRSSCSSRGHCVAGRSERRTLRRARVGSGSSDATQAHCLPTLQMPMLRTTLPDTDSGMVILGLAITNASPPSPTAAGTITGLDHAASPPPLATSRLPSSAATQFPPCPYRFATAICVAGGLPAVAVLGNWPSATSTVSPRSSQRLRPIPQSRPRSSQRRSAATRRAGTRSSAWCHRGYSRPQADPPAGDPAASVIRRRSEASASSRLLLAHWPPAICS